MNLNRRDWPLGMAGYSLTRSRQCSGQSPLPRRKLESDNSPAHECRGFTARVGKKGCNAYEGCRQGSGCYRQIGAVGEQSAACTRTVEEIMVRHFFHLTPIGPTPDTWEQEAEGRHLFRLYWVPLVPKPKLIEGQDAWLDRVYDALLCSTGTGCQSTRASK